MEAKPIWMKCTVTAQEPLRGALALALVDWGAGGVEEIGEEALAAYYPPDARERVEAFLDRYRADSGAEFAWRWEAIDDENWWESWKAYFHAFRASRRLWVRPSWEDAAPPEPGMKTLVIDPGRAFGTGGHETTRLCLEFLDQCLEESPVDKVLDVGSGSGILTAAARLLGVPRVTALDIDPVAVEVTRENLRLNGVEDGTEVFCGNLFAVEGRYPLVVSNILYQILMGMAPELARRVLPGGRLILAGFLVQEAASAEALFTAQGLRVERRAEMGPWGAFVFRAPE